jgi:hypothetical protein
MTGLTAQRAFGHHEVTLDRSEGYPTVAGWTGARACSHPAQRRESLAQEARLAGLRRSRRSHTVRDVLIHEYFGVELEIVG